MPKILFVAPTQGNGGIASWAANFRKRCPNEYSLISVGVSKRRSQKVTAGLCSRIIDGILDMIDTLNGVSNMLKDHPDIPIMHLTVSGKPGTIRDLLVLKVAKSKGVKCIMHCHFGSVWSQIAESSIWGKLLLRSMEISDQVWLLDNKSLSAIKAVPSLDDKAILTPNFLDVFPIESIASKKYKNIAYVGNLFPSKGIYELIQAIASLPNDTILHIVGPGTEESVERIKEYAGNKLGQNIILYGRVTNQQAIEIINKMDIIALPTYYPGEAFPISILEAMSMAKMVISCDRGAIRDMLTALDGTLCGIIVKPQDYKSIAEAILWCQNHEEEANIMCAKAYEKVSNSYRTEVIMRLYTDCYNKLL